jgi:hypothetical protein
MAGSWAVAGISGAISGTNAFEAGLARSMESPRMRHARLMVMGRAEPEPDVPCTTCELYVTMKSDGNWITPMELEQAGHRPAVTTGVVIEGGNSEATHADVFVAVGNPQVEPRDTAVPDCGLRGTCD